MHERPRSALRPGPQAEAARRKDVNARRVVGGRDGQQGAQADPQLFRLRVWRRLDEMHHRERLVPLAGVSQDLAELNGDARALTGVAGQVEGFTQVIDRCRIAHHQLDTAETLEQLDARRLRRSFRECPPEPSPPVLNVSGRFGGSREQRGQLR